jgi:uncharacterized protein DUF1844
MRGLRVRRYQMNHPDAKLTRETLFEGHPLSEPKHDDTFRVIDRRPFTAEGERREEVIRESEHESQRELTPTLPKASAEQGKSAAPTPAPPANAPARIPAFENLVRMLGSNAAMVLGAYVDPRTGQPVIDPEAARELIDMLDALREKTRGNLAPEEDDMLLDLLGKLKMTYLEINQAIAKQATQAKAKARS